MLKIFLRFLSHLKKPLNMIMKSNLKLLYSALFVVISAETVLIISRKLAYFKILTESGVEES
jgi:hypothetical protein